MTAESWISVGRQAVCALGLAAVAAGWGDLALRGLRVPVEDRPPWRLAVGLLVLAYSAFLAALAGILTLYPVLAVSFAGVLMLARVSSARPVVDAASPPAAWRVSLGVMLLLLFVLSLYPPHAFDETTYHLPMAASLAEHGEVRWLDQLRMPLFPQITEALAAVMMLLGGSPATHLVQAVALCALVLLLAGDRSPSAGWLAGAFLLGSPLLIYQATSLYVDLLLALAVMVAVLAAERLREGREGGWWLLSAFAAGVAPGIKYLGLMGTLLGLGLVGSWVGGERRFQLVLGYGAVVGLVALPAFWLLWSVTGNPVFPFADSVFGGSPWAMRWGTGSAGSRFLDVAFLPWNAFANRRLAGFQPPPSPWLWVALLATFAALWRRPSPARFLAWGTLSYLALALVVYVTMGAATGLDIRYFIPAAPLLALAAARSVDTRWATENAPGFGRRRLDAAVILGLALPGLAYGAFQIWRLGPVPLNELERREFLAEQHQGLRALREAERHSRTVFVIGNERLTGLGRSVVYGDAMGRLPGAEAGALLATPKSLAARLDGIGVEGLIVLRRAWPSQLDPETLSTSGRFALTYQDDEALVWRVLPRRPRPDR